MIAAVLFYFFSNIPCAVANEKEPAFCATGMTLRVSVESVHSFTNIGDCGFNSTDASDTRRLERENDCIIKDGHKGIEILVQPGSSDEWNTTRIPPWVDKSNGVFRFDAVWGDLAPYVEYNGAVYNGEHDWAGISENDIANVKFTIYNNLIKQGDEKKIDVRPYKSSEDYIGKRVFLKWDSVGTQGWQQLTVSVVVKCDLEECDNRNPIKGLCSSTLDSQTCYSLTYSDFENSNGESVTKCQSNCPEELFEGDATGNCVLKKCDTRKPFPILKCGSSDCFPTQDNASCSLLCPPFFTANPSQGECIPLPCLVRDPVSSTCSVNAQNNDKCGYLKGNILCVKCPEDHYEETKGVCTLINCTKRIGNAYTQYACGDGSCFEQLDHSCDTKCPSVNFVSDARGVCVLKDCCKRETVLKRSGFPCDSSTCYLQPKGDSCANDCPDGYTSDSTTGVCVWAQCSDRIPSSQSSKSQTLTNTNTYTHTKANIDVNASINDLLLTSIPSLSSSFVHTPPTFDHLDSPFDHSHTSSNPSPTFTGATFCTGQISVKMNFNMVHFDTNIASLALGGLKVIVKIGEKIENRKETGAVPNHGGVYWDAEFKEINQEVLVWPNVDQNDLEETTFQIVNGDDERPPKKVDLNAYKITHDGLEPVGIEVLNSTGYQMMIYLDLSVKCELEVCSARTPTGGSCDSSLDGADKCVTLIEPGYSRCNLSSQCTARGKHYKLDTTRGLCVLKPCTERLYDGATNACGSPECVKKENTVDKCDYTECPDFYVKNEDNTGEPCRPLDCIDRNPHAGSCYADKDEVRSTKCGFLSDGHKCVICDFEGYTYYDNGLCCANDHYDGVSSTISSEGPVYQCKLRSDCTKRFLNTSTTYLCGKGCVYRPESDSCAQFCRDPSDNAGVDARGFCNPVVPETPCQDSDSTGPSSFPCQDATCFLQPNKTCKEDCPPGYRPDFKGVCINTECTLRTFNGPEEENWPCGFPEEECFLDVGGPNPEKCVEVNCTSPFYESRSDDAIRTGRCTRIPCEDRDPQAVPNSDNYECGDGCDWIPPKNKDADETDVGFCANELPPPTQGPPPAKKTVKDFWWIFLLIGLLALAVVAILLFIFLWGLKKHHDAQVENDRELMRLTREERERTKNDRRLVKEEVANPEAESGIFSNDAQALGDLWKAEECSDEWVVEAVRCAPPFDIVQCDRRRTLFALYAELSVHAMADAGSDPVVAFRRLLPNKLRDPLDPSTAVALVLRHLHGQQQYSTGVGDITPHSLLVSTKGSLALVIKKAMPNVYSLGNEMTNASDGAFENIRWLAPEQKFDAGVTCATDIYSMALVMWQVSTPMHEIPLAELDSQSAYTRMASSYRPSTREIAEVAASYDIRALVSLIESCWSQEPSERPNASDAVQTLSTLGRKG